MAAQAADRLDDAQVELLRGAIAAGGRPRVRVLGSQFPDGTTGTVVRVGDPARDGTDFIVVRIKVGAVTDELGFAPDELSSGRRAGGRAAAEKVTAKSAAKSVAKAPAKAVAAKAVPPAVRPRAVRKRSAQAETLPVAPPAPKPVTPAKLARGTGTRRAAALPTVTITVTSSGATWSVSATRGARSVVKKAPLAPGVVTAVAELIGRPEIHDAVEAVNGAALDEAEARAEKLRAELAEIEAVLTSHRPPR